MVGQLRLSGSGGRACVHFIVPCGGDEVEAESTQRSIFLVAERNSGIDFSAWFVFNNNLYPSKFGSEVDRLPNLTCRTLDINPVASVSAARNVAIDAIVGAGLQHASTSVAFLDSGDWASDNLLRAAHCDDALCSLILGRTLVVSDKSVFVRPSTNLRLKSITNPIYLGSALLPVDFIGATRFEEGRKEDWKFWLAILKKRPSIKKYKEIGYAYTIGSNVSHATRKSQLISSQYQFYSEFLKYNSVKSLLWLLLHYACVTIIWFIWLPALKVFLPRAAYNFHERNVKGLNKISFKDLFGV